MGPNPRMMAVGQRWRHSSGAVCTMKVLEYPVGYCARAYMTGYAGWAQIPLLSRYWTFIDGPHEGLWEQRKDTNMGTPNDSIPLSPAESSVVTELTDEQLTEASKKIAAEVLEKHGPDEGLMLLLGAFMFTCAGRKAPESWVIGIVLASYPKLLKDIKDGFIKL